MAITTEHRDSKVQAGQAKAMNLRNTQKKTDELYANTADLETQIADVEAALQDAGKVNTVSVNGGTPVQPDGNKNVNLPIGKNTVGLGNVTNENANTLISTHNGNSSAHTDIRNAVSAVEELATEAKTLAEGRARAVVFTTKALMESTLYAENDKTKYKVGDNIFIEEVGVPDYWVKGILAQKVSPYGWYDLAPLETQKVDLTDINAHIANKSNPHGVTKSQVGLGSVVNKGMDENPTADSDNYVKSAGVAAALAGKEPAFTKKSAFNKDFGTTLPIMDGTASAGTADTVARSDHKHPSDSTRVPATRKVAGKALSADVTLGSLTIAGKTYNGSAGVVVSDSDFLPSTYTFTESSWVASNNADYGNYMLTVSAAKGIVAVYDSSGMERDVQLGKTTVYTDVKFGGTLKYYTREVA